MARARKPKTSPSRAKRSRVAKDLPALIPASDGMSETLDELRATVIALLASLRAKEHSLREQGGSHPAPGVLAGLSDIGAIRVWADRTLRTIDVLSRGATGEVARLLEELGEFRELVERVASPSPAEAESAG